MLGGSDDTDKLDPAYWERQIALEDEEFTSVLQNLADLQRGVRLETLDLRDTIDGWHRALDAVQKERQFLATLCSADGRASEPLDTALNCAPAPAPARRRIGLLDGLLGSLNVARVTPIIIDLRKIAATLHPKRGGIAPSPSSASPRATTPPLTSAPPTPPEPRSPVPPIATPSQLSTIAAHIAKLRRIQRITIALNPHEEQGTMQYLQRLAKKAPKKGFGARPTSAPASQPIAPTPAPAPMGGPEDPTKPASTTPPLAVTCSLRASAQPHPSSVLNKPGQPERLVLLRITLTLGGPEEASVSEDGEDDQLESLQKRVSASMGSVVDEMRGTCSDVDSESRALLDDLISAMSVTCHNAASQCGTNRIIEVVVTLEDSQQLLGRVAASSSVSVLKLIEAVADKCVAALTPEQSSATTPGVLLGDDGRACIERFTTIMEENNLHPHDAFLLLHALALRDGGVAASATIDVTPIADVDALVRDPVGALWDAMADPMLHFLADKSTEPCRFRDAQLVIENFPNELLQAANKIVNGEKRKLPKGMETGPMAVSSKTKIALALGVYDQLHIDILRPHAADASGVPEKELPVEPFILYANKEIRERAAHLLALSERRKTETPDAPTITDTVTAELESRLEVGAEGDSRSGAAVLRALATSFERSELETPVRAAQETLKRVNAHRILNVLRRFECLEVSFAIPSPFAQPDFAGGGEAASTSLTLTSPVFLRLHFSCPSGLRSWLPAV